jgi:hypothetical protein
VVSCGLDASGSGWGPVGGCCEHSNKPSGSIKGEEFIDWPSEYWVINKDSAAWC